MHSLQHCFGDFGQARAWSSHSTVRRLSRGASASAARKLPAASNKPTLTLQLLDVRGSLADAPLDASMHTMKLMACLTALAGRSLETREADVPALQKAAAWEEIRQRCQLGRGLLTAAREAASDEQAHREIEVSFRAYAGLARGKADSSLTPSLHCSSLTLKQLLFFVNGTCSSRSSS